MKDLISRKTAIDIYCRNCCQPRCVDLGLDGCEGYKALMAAPPVAETIEITMDEAIDRLENAQESEEFSENWKQALAIEAGIDALKRERIILNSASKVREIRMHIGDRVFRIKEGSE